jgi:site-specific DNA-adenine methylase
MKYLYIVDHAISFPSSEYGGLWNVIAENDDECFDLISNHWEYQEYEEYYPKLRENIVKAEKFALVENEESRVVEAFTT